MCCICWHISSPVSSSVMIMVPGPNEFHAVQLYVDWKSDSMMLLMVSVDITAPPCVFGLLCSTVYRSDRVPFSFSHTFSFHAHTWNKHTTNKHMVREITRMHFTFKQTHGERDHSHVLHI